MQQTWTGLEFTFLWCVPIICLNKETNPNFRITSLIGYFFSPAKWNLKGFLLPACSLPKFFPKEESFLDALDKRWEMISESMLLAQGQVSEEEGVYGEKAPGPTAGLVD